jgi:tetratricopeptide (TPR) repeat protein
LGIAISAGKLDLRNAAHSGRRSTASRPHPTLFYRRAFDGGEAIIGTLLLRERLNTAGRCTSAGRDRKRVYQYGSALSFRSRAFGYSVREDARRRIATETPAYDLFFSYRRSELARTRPLLDAMARAGLKVWRDENSIPDGAPITREIREGIASSKILVALYSNAYPLSKACQQELALAYLAAQRAGESPNERVLIINPESSFDHLPLLLRDHLALRWTDAQAGFDDIAARVSIHVSGLNSTLAAAMLPLPRFFGMVPIEANRFVGRHTAMWDLHGNLTANRISIISSVQGQCVTRIRGLGGNGKTLLAREYAIRFGAAYPGGIFWVNAYGNDDFAGGVDTTNRESLRHEQIRQFAIDEGVPIDGATPEQVEARFWHHLRRRGDACLWIVDDLPSGITSGDLERKWCAQWPGASTLLTCRTREHDSLGTYLDLAVLEPQECIELLRRHRLPASAEEEFAAQKIIEALGNHPLALDVAGGYLAKGIQNFGEYLNDLWSNDRDVLEIAAQLRASLPTGHERSISRTLLKSIALLNAAGLEFFRIASVMAPSSIPISLIQDMFSTSLVPPSGARLAFQDALDQGDTLGLCDPAGDDGRIVHPLISRVFHFREANDGSRHIRRRSLLQTLLRRLSALANIREHPNLIREVVHARYLLGARVDDQDEAKIALWIARYDFDRGDYQAARELQGRILQTYQRLFGDNHPDTVTAMNNLAHTLSVQGALTEARQLLETAATLHRHLHGSNHPDTPMALNNLAGVLFAQGDLQGARALQEQALSEIRRMLGDTHDNTLTVMLNMSVTMQAQGDLPSARQLQEFVRRSREQSLGNDHPSTLAAAGDLATTLATQGHLAEAREIREKVLDQTRRLWGDDHPDTLHVMFNLASTLLAQGDLVGARSLSERILEAYRRLLGESHPDTLGAMNNLASTMQEQGDWQGAKALLEKLVEVRDRISGIDHPDSLSSKNNLALALLSLGDYVRAREIYTSVLDGLVRKLGPAHPNTLTTKASLAYTLYKEGQLAIARAMQEEVLSETNRVLGQDHADTLRAMNNLALMMKDEGKIAEARALEEMVWARSRIKLGAEHPNTLTALNNLADTLKRAGDLQGAISLYEQLVVSRICILGNDHPDTLAANNNLATALHSQGHSQRAAALGETVLEASRRVLGNGHPNTLKAIENLAEMRFVLGDTRRAFDLRNEAAKIRKGSALTTQD